MSISKWPHVFGLSLCLAFCFIQCNKTPSAPDPGEDEQIFTILYTSDEHGWIEESETSPGAANLSGLWKKWLQDSTYLILSGGDSWTGPAIGTWSKGEAVVDVMNAMGYQASVVGNHEFDYDIQNLNKRIDQSAFTYLSANIRTKRGNNIPEGIQPFTIFSFGEFSIGLIGLTTTSTHVTAFPKYVEALEFTPYTEAIEELLPQLNERETDINIVLGHVPASEMSAYASQFSAFNIPLVLCGHGHKSQHIMNQGIDLVEPGAYLQNYAQIDLIYNTNLDSITDLSIHIKKNQNGNEDPEVKQIVSLWQDRVNTELDEIIGYVEGTLNINDPVLGYMVTNAWLETITVADIAFINKGGIRQGLSSGDITKKTLWSVLPFENHLIQLKLTGTQVENILKNRGESLAWAGIFRKDNTLFIEDDAIDSDSTYTVLTLDYLYYRSDYPLEDYDPDPEFYTIHYRDPVIGWIQSLSTSSLNPLDIYLIF